VSIAGSSAPLTGSTGASAAPSASAPSSAPEHSAPKDSAPKDSTPKVGSPSHAATVRFHMSHWKVVSGSMSKRVSSLIHSDVCLLELLQGVKYISWCNEYFRDELPDLDLSEPISAVDVNVDHTTAVVQEMPGLSHAL